MKKICVLLVLAALAAPTVALAQDATKSDQQDKNKSDKPKKDKSAKPKDPASIKPKGLFASESVVEFTLTAPLQKILKDRGQVTSTHLGQLRYADGQETRLLPVKLTVRGNFRKSRANCTFPPLYVDVPKGQVKKTLFAKQNKIKLVTHCTNEEYVVREYLVYKMYNLLTEASFRARLARVTYVDSAGRRDPETRWGILLEDEGDLMKRNGGTATRQKQVVMARVDSASMATVAVFEYLIGNTDWSVPFRHNIRLMTRPNRLFPTPIPYDFDHAGIVDANYAVPAEQLNLGSVRERLYRGISYPTAVLEPVLRRFNELKPRFYALFQNDPRLSPAYVKRTVKYLDEFYEVLSRPASVAATFQKGKKDTDNVVIKGLK